MRANARVEGRIIIRGKEYFKYVISPEFVGVPNARNRKFVGVEDTGQSRAAVPWHDCRNGGEEIMPKVRVAPKLTTSDIYPKRFSEAGDGWPIPTS